MRMRTPDEEPHDDGRSRRGRPPRRSTIALRYPRRLARDVQLIARSKSLSVSDYVHTLIQDQVRQHSAELGRDLANQIVRSRRLPRWEQQVGDDDQVYIELNYPWRFAQLIRVLAMASDFRVGDYIRAMIEEPVKRDAADLARDLQSRADS